MRYEIKQSNMFLIDFEHKHLVMLLKFILKCAMCGLLRCMQVTLCKGQQVVIGVPLRADSGRHTSFVNYIISDRFVTMKCVIIQSAY